MKTKLDLVIVDLTTSVDAAHPSLILMVIINPPAGFSLTTFGSLIIFSLFGGQNRTKKLLVLNLEKSTLRYIKKN
ncbi:hypothetical protein PanWU01x14_139060 [Parasponia andersonii]|uniref:Uncharacterized protein n=1 Tax=Parasponia andersonii TaxID=3476 RepID=A0A2P5CMW8_PARAD|nr:hypothetical protein PanWU01x14_139060 [Parasponia andersonii]